MENVYIDFAIQQWPWLASAVAALAVLWVAFVKISKLTTWTKKDDEIVEMVEKNSIGKRISAYLKRISPLK